MLIRCHLLPVLLNLNRLCFTHLSLQLVLELTEGHPKHGLQVTHKSVHVAFAWHFMNDVLVIVVPKASAQLLIIHLWLVFAGTPPTGHLFWINKLELPLSTSPSNAVLTVPVSEKFQQELPQLDGS